MSQFSRTDSLHLHTGPSNQPLLTNGRHPQICIWQVDGAVVGVPCCCVHHTLSGVTYTTTQRGNKTAIKLNSGLTNMEFSHLRTLMRISKFKTCFLLGGRGRLSFRWSKQIHIWRGVLILYKTQIKTSENVSFFKI